MSYKFNDKFSWYTFEDECRDLNKPVHLLTFQDDSVYKELAAGRVYKASADYGSRDNNTGFYKALEGKLGYVPIWCYNPLQFSDDVSTVWKTDWFSDGALWRRFMEHSAFDTELIVLRTLIEIRVDSTELIRDCINDSGFVCMVKCIKPEQVVGCYRLVYPDEDADDWFYPWIYPFKDNTELASFNKIQQFME